NGADLIVSEKHDLPLISFAITFMGGADQFEPAGRQGVGSLTASLLSEGTRTRDGEALSNALHLLGTAVNATAASETGSIGAGSTTAGERPAFSYPPVADPKATTIFLVDKHGAAQSTFAIGRPGPPRSTPDFYALQFMNTILGGMFQSRLNANMREAKGYSYGVSSGFAFGRGPCAFRAGGDIVSAKMEPALGALIRQLRGMA